MLSPSEYQSGVRRTMGHLDRKDALANYGLGIGGEAGEVMEPIKKDLYHKKPLDLTKMAKELGDVLWYVTAIADTLGLKLEDIMAANLEKLRERYPDGFQMADI